MMVLKQSIWTAGEICDRSCSWHETCQVDLPHVASITSLEGSVAEARQCATVDQPCCFYCAYVTTRRKGQHRSSAYRRKRLLCRQELRIYVCIYCISLFLFEIITAYVWHLSQPGLSRNGINFRTYYHHKLRIIEDTGRSLSSTLRTHCRNPSRLLTSESFQYCALESRASVICKIMKRRMPACRSKNGERNSKEPSSKSSRDVARRLRLFLIAGQ